MDLNLSSEFSNVPQNSSEATKRIMELLLNKICPVLQSLRAKLWSSNVCEMEDELAKLKNVYMLCSSQIKKCIINFLDIIRMENKQGVHLQESRKFIYERLTWCVNKLLLVEDNLDKCKHRANIRLELSEDPMFTTPMYFVNWIDYTFEILGKLAEDVYRTDYKNDELLYEEWKESMVEHATSLHMCIDELLLSAMTLCKYCLNEDQTVLRARCQVVLRETKALFGELINEDISSAVKISKDKLKLPVMPSNVNMMIDVLKDVLYVLETNTNTALLALLIHCYVNCISPVDVLQDHFAKQENYKCLCGILVDGGIDNCHIVKEFDLYNERLQQIGSFAVSCSSDLKRILTLRSCLSSLESLDPHLVPSMTTSPNGHHSELLANFWKQEVLEIRDTVFLIVDPVAFVEKCKLYMRDLLLEMKLNNQYSVRELWVVTSIGRMVYDFFSTYKKYEPEAIANSEELDRQLRNVLSAHKECKTVLKLICERGDFLRDLYDVGRSQIITMGSIVTRAKVVYSMVKGVYELIRPKDNDDQMFEEEDVVNRNLTHTIQKQQQKQFDNVTFYSRTSVTCNSQRKTKGNFTRSVFARTGVKSSSRVMFLSKLTNHLKVKKGAYDELSFSAQVSELFNAEKKTGKPEKCSLRKMLMNKQRSFPFLDKGESYTQLYEEKKGAYRMRQDASQQSILDVAESLQISEILHQINNLTTTIPWSDSDSKGETSKAGCNPDNDVSVQGLLGDLVSMSNISNTTQPSNVTTLERINDLDLVEVKLNSLRANCEFETHL